MSSDQIAAFDAAQAEAARLNAIEAEQERIAAEVAEAAAIERLSAINEKLPPPTAVKAGDFVSFQKGGVWRFGHAGGKQILHYTCTFALVSAERAVGARLAPHNTHGT